MFSYTTAAIYDAILSARLDFINVVTEWSNFRPTEQGL